MKQKKRRVGLILLVICVVTSLFTSCKMAQSGKDSEKIKGNKKTEAAEINQKNEKKTVESSAEELFAAKLKAGEVRSDYGSNQSRESSLQALAQWYGENALSEYGKIIEIHWISERTLPYFENFELSVSNYCLTFQKDSYVSEQYITLLVGKLPEANEQYILIDGEITKYGAYSLKSHWDKVMNHAVFGKLAGEFPKAALTDGITEIDIGSVIGKDYIALNYFAFGKQTVGILSAKPMLDGRGYQQYTINLFDLKTNKKYGKAHTLTKPESQWMFGSILPDVYQIDETTVVIEQMVENADPNSKLYASYEVKISKNGKISDKLTMRDEPEINSELKILKSDSGRYIVRNTNNDIYLHDSLKNTDVLVYDSKPDDIHTEPKSVMEYQFGNAQFFIGDRLYYSVHGYEWPVGIGAYDSNTGEASFFENRIDTNFYAGGYVYGYSSVHSDDFYFGRAPLDDLLKTERLVFDMKAESNFLCSNNKKYVIQVMKPEYSDHSLKLNSDISKIIIYDAVTFRPVKTELLTSAVNCFDLGHSKIIGDYLFIAAEGEGTKAYVVKIS